MFYSLIKLSLLIVLDVAIILHITNCLSFVAQEVRPKAHSADSLSSSRESESDFVLGSKVSLCPLCFDVVRDCGLTHFRLKMMSTSSSVHLLLAFIFLNACRAYFRRSDCKGLCFFASDLSYCFLSIVRKRSSKSSIFSFLPSNISVFVFVALNKVDEVWGRCCDAMPAIAFVSLLIRLLESEFCLGGVCLTIGNVLSGEIWIAIFCGWVICCDSGRFGSEFDLWGTVEDCGVGRYALSLCDEFSFSRQSKVSRLECRYPRSFLHKKSH